MKGYMLKILVCAMVLGGGMQPALASVLTGQEILADLALNTLLSGSGTVELEMTTENARGTQRSYGLRVFRSQDEDAEKQLVEYLNPADVRGTKFLSLAETDGEAQMWLYMPALGRERRLAAHMIGDSFMGTDFTYEEITAGFNFADKYQANRLADAQVDGLAAYVLDLTADEGVSYRQVRMWIWQDRMVPLVIEMYGPGGTLAKRLLLSDFREVQGELVPHQLIMQDELAGTRTLLRITSLDAEEVSDDVFTLRYLRR